MTDEAKPGKKRATGPPESFEDALKALEETVQRLESGGLTLDESARLYEEGIKLARFCSERIAAAELKITKIKTAYGEQMRFMDDAGDDGGDGGEGDGDELGDENGEDSSTSQ
jgi:exodeoxyribonuclease VII small subunit